MTVLELMAAVEAVTDEAGNKKAVLDWAVWEEIVAMLEGLPEGADQAWYWSPAWQAQEREADQERAAGDYEEFETVDDFVNSL